MPAAHGQYLLDSGEGSRDHLMPDVYQAPLVHRLNDLRIEQTWQGHPKRKQQEVVEHRGCSHEATEHLEAFSRPFLRDLDVEQVQMDELFPLLSAVKDGEGSEGQALKRLSRFPHWVWVAMARSARTMAQRLVHQVTRVLAPHCAPLFLTDGLCEYLTALVTHDGQGIQPERHQSQGPQPQPRWMPLPKLLDAQVVKRYRRRRIVGGTHRVVFGPAATIESILAKRGWKINSSFIERRNLGFR